MKRKKRFRRINLVYTPYQFNFSIHSILLLLTLSIFSPPSNNKGKPLKQKRFNTKELHQLSKDIFEEIEAIESVQGTVNESKCPEVKNILSQLSKKTDIYEKMESWETSKFLEENSEEFEVKNFKLLNVDKNHIIKKEKLTFRWKSAKVTMPYFRNEMKKLKRELSSYRGELKVLRKRLKVCQRRYSNCIDVLENNYSKDRTKDIKYLVGLSIKTDEELLSQRDDILLSLDVKEKSIVSEKSINQFCSDYFGYVEYGLIGYLKYRLSGRTDTVSCNNSHIRWTNLRNKNFRNERIPHIQDFKGNGCELDYLKEKSIEWNFGETIDSIWIIQQQAKTSNCAQLVRICPCISGDTLTPRGVRDPTCMGCKDKQALNYCSYARYSGPCQYLVCSDSCFAEAYAETYYENYNPSQDELIIDNSLCQTEICGCMDENCDNYDKTATIPDDSCNCGCLEPWAVNDASDKNSSYYNPRITENDPSKCHKMGCTSPCAINYDPKAEEDDGSCECEMITKGELQAATNVIGLEQIDRAGSTKVLRDKFRAIFQGHEKTTQKVANKLQFDRGTSDVDDLVVKGKLKIDGIGLGQWTYPAIYEVIESLVDFLDTEMTGAGGILHENLEVKIIGEADGHRIKFPGIQYTDEPFVNSPFKIFYPKDDISLDYMAQDNFSIQPNKVADISEEKPIRENIFLAFVRAGMVKKKLLIRGAGKVNPQNIFIGVRANPQKGGGHRAISVVFVVRKYFRFSLDNLDQKRNMYTEASKYYDEFGYPLPGKTYSRCPCLDFN